MTHPVFNLDNFKKLAMLVNDHHPGQIFNTLRFGYHAARGFPTTQLPYDPLWLICRVTARCNLNCRQCNFLKPMRLQGLDPFRDMTLELFRRILDAFPRSMAVSLTGGEPLGHAQIVDMINLAHQRHLKVHLVTNGTLLSGQVDALLRAPVEHFNISFYGTDSRNFSQMTGADGSLFEEILRGVEQLARRRRPGGYPRLLRTSFICTKDNLDRVLDFIHLSEELGVDQVKLKNLYFYGIPGFKPAQGLYAHDPEVQDFIAKLSRQRFRLPVFLPRLYQHDDRRRCFIPFKWLTIDGGGFISPCCVVNTAPCYDNFFRQPDLWNQSAMTRIRQDWLDPARPLSPPCRYCELRISERPHVRG